MPVPVTGIHALTKGPQERRGWPGQNPAMTGNGFTITFTVAGARPKLQPLGLPSFENVASQLLRVPADTEPMKSAACG